MQKYLLVLLLLPIVSIAQKPLNLTLFGGFSNYSGDIQPKRFTMNQAFAAVGAGLTYEFSPHIAVRGSLVYSKVGADDKKNIASLKPRNLNFETKIFEAALLAEYSFMDIEDKGFTPYVFAGVAIFRFNPYAIDSNGNKAFLIPLGTEGQGLAAYPDRKPYSMYQAALPFGAGIRFRINNNTTIGYEIGLRKLFTDYLDDVSMSYVDPVLLAEGRGQRAVDLSYRGDELKDGVQEYPINSVRGGPDYKDWYYYSGITLSIRILNDDGKLFKRRTGRGSLDCPRGVL